MDDETFCAQVDLFMLSACAEFDRIFKSRTGLSFAQRNTKCRHFCWDFPSYDEQMDWRKPKDDYISLDEVADIISEGMVIRWMNGYLYAGEGMTIGNFVNTRDFQVYSPSAFLSSLHDIYNASRARYRQLVNDFSYNHADLQ